MEIPVLTISIKSYTTRGNILLGVMGSALPLNVNAGLSRNTLVVLLTPKL